ncbi:HtaA domain-containing protein [Trueperella sp. LYQ143]|uniref:HtaA domain-containing protein n=1 Tax=Trueperella sp. LYQ143 TaxID=3391059 RepID=UPI0039831E38
MRHAKAGVWRFISAALTLFLALILTLSAYTVSASADESPANEAPYAITKATFTWNIRDSWYSYLTSPHGGAPGSVTPRNGARIIRKQLYWGTGYGNCSTSGNCTITYPGTYIFKKHSDSQGGYFLDITIQNLRITTEGNHGFILAHTRSRDMNNPSQYLENPDLRLATFELATPVSIENNQLHLNGITPTITQDAAPYFGGNYGGEAGSAFTLTAEAYQPNTPDAQDIIREQQQDTDRIDVNALQWSVIKDFLPKATKDNLLFQTDSGASPVSNYIEFKDPTGVMENGVLKVTYPGKLTLYKNGTEADKKSPIFSMSGIRLEISRHDRGEIYMTVSRDAGAAEEIHFGTFYAPIYTDWGQFTIHASNATVRLDDNARLELPYLGTSDDVAPLNFRINFDWLSPDDDQRAKTFHAIYDEPRPDWTKRWPIFIQTTPIYRPEVPHDDVVPSVEEENAAWQDSPAPAAHDGQFIWGIKRSWQSYIGRGTLADGLEFSNKNYIWPAANNTSAQRLDDGTIVLRFRGNASWNAYGGLLDIALGDIEAHLRPLNPNDYTQGFEKDIRIYGKLANTSSYRDSHMLLGAIRGDVTSKVAAAANDSSTAELALNLENQPFYLGEDPAPIFMNVYRAGLRMDNASFAGTVRIPFSVSGLPQPPNPTPISPVPTPQPAPTPGETPSPTPHPSGVPNTITPGTPHIINTLPAHSNATPEVSGATLPHTGASLFAIVSAAAALCIAGITLSIRGHALSNTRIAGGEDSYR